MSDKTTFFFPDTRRLLDKIQKEAEEKQKEGTLNKDGVLQNMNKQLTTFAFHNNIKPDEAIELLAKAEQSIEAQASTEKDFFKFNALVFKIAQRMLDQERERACGNGYNPRPNTPESKA